jgi:hypothetical protein
MVRHRLRSLELKTGESSLEERKLVVVWNGDVDERGSDADIWAEGEADEVNRCRAR